MTRDEKKARVKAAQEAYTRAMGWAEKIRYEALDKPKYEFEVALAQIKETYWKAEREVDGAYHARTASASRAYQAALAAIDEEEEA